MQGVIKSSDVPPCAASVTYLYDHYKMLIADIRTAGERDAILAQMKERYEWYQHSPENADQLTEVYQLLRRKCLQAGARTTRAALP